MEEILTDTLVDREVELYCLGGGQFAGHLKAVRGGVAILEWEEKETFIACDKIVAAWPKDKGRERNVSGLGFIR